VKLPRVHRVARGGRVYRYHRVTRAPLPDVPEDHPDFLRAWMAEEAKGAPRADGLPAGSIGRAVDDYLDSRDLAGVGAAYRGIVRRHLTAVAGGKLGRADLRDLAPRHIRHDLDALAPSVAQARLKAWRRLLAWCERRGLIEADPSAGVAKPRLTGDGHAPWSPDDVARFRARWPLGTVPRAAMELLFWTAARVGDAGGLTRGMVRGGVLTYRQAKTGGEAHVPWDGPLPVFAESMAGDRDLMHAALAALGTAGLLILPTQDGQRRTAKGLGNTVNDAARAAGLAGRTAHGLRKARLVALAEARATTHQIAAWGGHSSLSEIEHYTRAADRRRAVLA
jgi:integrase/recombinase XerD